MLFYGFSVLNKPDSSKLCILTKSQYRIPTHMISQFRFMELFQTTLAPHLGPHSEGAGKNRALAPIFDWGSVLSYIGESRQFQRHSLGAAYGRPTSLKEGGCSSRP